MERAFKSMHLPLGGYQTSVFSAIDLGDQFTRGGAEPRTMVMILTTPNDEQFTMRAVTCLLSEESQRHLIAALQANLDDNQQRARELITIFHRDYGKIEQ